MNLEKPEKWQSVQLIMRLLLFLRAWWQRQLDAVDDQPPYPLTQDEWDAMQDQEEKTLTLQAIKLSKSISYINSHGKLISVSLGGSTKGRWLRLFAKPGNQVLL